MTDALCIAAVSFAVGFIAAHLLRITRAAHADATQADAWRREYENECKRHDATLRQMQQRESIAAANIVQLCGVVHAQQAQRAVVSVPPPVRVWLN